MIVKLLKSLRVMDLRFVKKNNIGRILRIVFVMVRLKSLLKNLKMNSNLLAI